MFNLRFVNSQHMILQQKLYILEKRFINGVNKVSYTIFDNNHLIINSF